MFNLSVFFMEQSVVHQLLGIMRLQNLCSILADGLRHFYGEKGSLEYCSYLTEISIGLARKSLEIKSDEDK